MKQKWKKHVFFLLSVCLSDSPAADWWYVQGVLHLLPWAAGVVLPHTCSHVLNPVVAAAMWQVTKLERGAKKWFTLFD